MSRAALGYLRRQYLCVLRRCAWFNALAASGMVLTSMGVQAQSIVTDGRTQTQVAVSGSVTDITTQTIRGANAYNSFSKFNVDSGYTVNLHLPGQTSNLLNLVHGERSYINGLVNAYKNGQIGGNVFFFNPHGAVVGSQGVLNVGSLTLAAPTSGFMDQLVASSGAISDAATAMALAGQVPLSQTGLVLVKGRINAAEAVTLAAGNVNVDAGAQVFAGARAQVAFADLVNVEGMATAADVQLDGGVIRIVAAQDITVAGQVSADGLGADSNGGTVMVMAERNSTLAATGKVSADAGETGDGGFVEFSAKRDVTLQGNGLSAKATQGQAGEILIDPENLTWSGSGNDFYSHGANVTITATQKVTLDDVVVSSRNIGGAADTRANHTSGQSQGKSGDISVSAKEIEIKNGSQLLAQADNGQTAGAISITATDNQSTPLFGSVEDSIASVSISNAVIKGGNVSIKATANDKWVWTGNEYGDTILDFLGSLRVGANLTISKAHATIDVDDGASIDASGTLDIESHSIADASMKVMSTVVGFGYGETDSQAKVNIGNATLGSDGAMSLKSQADSTLSVSVDTVNTGAFSNAASSASKYANLSFAVGIGKQMAETTVGSNATIARASALDVEASGEKSHSVAASGGSFKDGIASAGISVLVSDTTLTASLGGNVTAGQVAVKSTLAEAETEVSAAAGTAGSPDLQEAITSAKPVDEILFEKLSDFVAAAPSTDSRSGASSKLGLSAAFAWVENDNNVKAEVAGGAHVTTPGKLDVLAKAEESVSFETSAAVDQRDLDTQLPGDPNAPEDKKKVAISASVAVIDMNHHADALIGDGAVISAGNAVNVNAQTLISPFWSQWDTLIGQFKTMDWNSADAWYKLGEALYDVAGDPVNATSWTQTAVESEKLAFAGAVDFFTLDHKATARIGAASINAGAAPITGAQDVNVVATASQGILNLVGVPEFDPTAAPGTNSNSGTAGFGGSYHQFNLTGGTDASIAAGAQVRADDVVALADTSFDQVTVAETVGKAGKVSINGAFSLVDTDLHTVAQIGAGGSMSANDVLVKAEDDSMVINVAGGVARSQSVGIGFSVAINELDREVRAVIGNRATESASGGSLTASGNLLLDAHAGGTQGAFTVAGSGPSSNESDAGKTGGDGTKTNAKDSGQQGKSGVGISGAASVNLVNDTTAAAIADLASVTVSGNAASSVAVDKDADGTVDETVSLARGLSAKAKNDALVLAGAGSLTVATGKSAGLAGAFTWNELVKDTRATIQDATVTVHNGGVNLDAENSKAMWSISAGGAAGDKVGIAGSVSYSTIDNVTEAAIDNANVDADSTVVLDADDTSDIRSVAGSVSYGGKAGVGAAVAISTVDSDTTARISGSGKTVNGDAGVSASATNDNDIISVAAAIGASQGVAASGAVTWNVISNKTEASMSGVTVSSSGNAVNLDADDTAEILAISGNAAVSTGQGSVGISGSYNEIDNETYAKATGGSLSGTSVRLEATEDAIIKAIAAGGSGSSKVAVSGSLGVNTIGNITEASATGTTLDTAGDATLRATDSSDIFSVTGAVGAAGNGAVGASGSYNHIGSSVTAAISGGSVDAANVLVDAERAAHMEVWAVAGTAAGTAGFAGSIALNDIGGVTTASVNGGADVEATGNALVTAESDDQIEARAGGISISGTASGAGAIAFNDVHSDTLAQVTGTNTKVTGLGNGKLDALVGLPSAHPLSGRQQKDNIRGAAVVASSTSQVENFTFSASGGGSASVAGTVSVAMMTGYTSAEVSDQAQVNASFGGAEQEARVAAYHHDNLYSVSGGGAIGGDVGAGGAMDTLIGSHITTAEVNQATLQGSKAVSVDAGSTNEIAQKVIGLGGGTYAGLSGSIGLILVDGKTQALVNGGNLNSRGDLTVEATSETDAEILAGAVSLSGVAGIGLTGTVSIYDQTTQAVVGDGSSLNANKATRIKAENDVEQDVIAGTASAAGGAGIAGTVDVAVIKGTTQAVVGAKSTAGAGDSHINADAGYGGAEQDVSISARDTTRVDNYLGGLGIGLGGAGVGAAVDVVMVNNGASAQVRSGATVDADRDITVSADTERMLDSFTIAAAGGSTVGISGAVSVLTAGSRPDSDAQSESGASVGEVARYVSANAFGDQMDSDAGGTSASRDRANAARANANVGNDLNAPAAANTAQASVAAGTTLNAGRDVLVAAHNGTDADAIAVGVAVSGSAALGGGVALAFIDDRTEAEAAGSITAGRNVTVQAGDGAVNDTQGLQLDVGDIHISQRTAASKLLTFAGGGGVVGLGASVAILDKSSSASAKVGDGADITALGTVAAAPGASTGLVTVDAGIDHELEVKGLGAAVGLAGVGVAVAYATESGAATAEVGSQAHVTGKALDVHGHAQTDTDAHVIAAAGGLISGAGADANVEDTSSASAKIGDGAVIRTASGLTQVRADVDPVAKAKALGVAVSAGVSIGVSLADATVQTRAEASTGGNVDVIADAMTVQAETRLRGKTAESDATAGAGGLLLGASASESNATVRTDTVADVGANNTIGVTGEFKVDANSDTYADADVTGINVGLLAGGSSAAKATTDTETYATVGDNPDLTADSVKIKADGNDTLRANTKSGAGGAGVLVASRAETEADSRTYARLGGATGTSGLVNAALTEITAVQHINFNASADSTSASVVGYSGARAINHINTDTRATLGPQVTVNTESFTAQAWNDIVKPALASGYNVDSGSGGLLNAAAARSESFIRNGALVDVGQDAQVNVTVVGSGVGTMNLAAWNQVDAHDRVRLDSGGAIAIAKAESEIQNDRNDAIVHLGQDAILLTDGEANLSARTTSKIHAAASSKTYGLAGAAEGDSAAGIRADNRIELAAGAKVEAEEDVHLMAGTDRVNGNDLYADAETRLWNYTAIPIENDPDARGVVIQHNTIDIAAGAQARSVKSVYLSAAEGSHRTRGFGEGTDAYRETLSAIGEFFGADTSSLKITGGSTYDNANVPFALLNGLDPASGVNVDGIVQAGIRHHQWLTLAADGLTVTSSEGMADKWQLRNGVSLASELAAEITALTNKANELRAAANSYAGSDATDAATALDNDARILQQQLDALNGAPAVGFIDIFDTTARTGNVHITGKYLTGQASGHIEAPGDVRIDIENQSTRFMQTAALTIPDEDGGLITFNGLGVSSNSDINQRNAFGKSAAIGTLLDAVSSPKPVIRVENTNDSDAIPDSPAQLWMRGDVNNLGGEAIAKSHGTLRVSANINAETVNIATGGDFIKTYTPGFTHQGGNPISQLGSLPDQREAAKVDYSQNGLTQNCSSGCSTTIAGNNVYISGEKLNINGLIQAGLPDRAILIDSSLLAATNPSMGIANSAAIAKLKADWQSGDHSTRYLDLNNPAPESSAIKVSYDAENDRLVLANVRMGGGHMELFGNVFSTGNGELRVMDGYGRINVTNTTGYDLAVGRLDTGPGVEGVIRITDTSQRDPNNNPLVTEITRLGNNIETRTSATVDADGKPSTLVSSTTGRSGSFAPTANRRFNWINGQRTQTDEDRIYTTRVLFGADWLVPDYDDPDRTNPPVSTYTSRLTGDWLSVGGTTADYAMDYSRYTSGPYKYKNDTENRNGVICIDGHCAYEDITRTAYYRTVVNEYFQHSLNASKAVKVSFTGFDSASLNVDAGTGQLLLGGLVRGLTGDTRLSGAAGIQSLSDEARVVASNLTLNATNGAIGSAAAPINIDLTDADAAKGLVDGQVTATALNGIAIKEVGGNLRAASIRASNGDVHLTADRNLAGTGAGTTVTGNNITLVSLSAAIGTDATPLVVDTQGSTTVLAASAAGDIHIQEASGDMRVNQVKSQAGDVHLSVPDGKLLDANSIEQVDESTRAELLALWDEMRLTGAKAEQARDQNLDAQTAKLKQEYEAYFRMRNLHRLDDGSYTADAYDSGYAYHATPVQAAVLKSANSWSDADVARYESEQTAAYHAANQRFGGSAYVVNYAPQLSDSEKSALSAGAVWSDGQLSNALSAGLFRPVSDTEVRIEDANIIGKNLTLDVMDGIGLEQATPVVIQRGTDLSTLSDEQKLALLTAELNDIEVVGNEIRISQKEDVDVTATGNLKASAEGDVLLGSEANLSLDQVTSLGEVRIKTGAAMNGVAGKTHITAARAILEAGSGDLGSAATPILIELPDGGQLTARAGGDLYVRELTGDMTVESVFAKGDVNLTALQSIVEAVVDRELDVRGDNVSLTAGDTIGRPGGDNALDVAVDALGRLDARAPNGIYLNSAGGSGQLGDITTQGDFSLTIADGSMTVVGLVQADASVQLGADDNVEFAGGSVHSDGPVTIRAGLDGSGSVLGNAQSGPDVVAGSDVFISAPDVIGGAAPLEVDTDGELALQGRLISVVMQPVTPGNPAELRVSGLNGTLAQDVNLDIQGAGDTVLHTFVVGNGQVTTDSANLQVDLGHVGDHASFFTPYFSARIDHLDRNPTPGMDVRGFTLDGDFDLGLTPTVANIGAYVINQNPRRIVYGNPASYADRESGESLRSLQTHPGQSVAFDGLPVGASPRGHQLVTLNLDWMDEEYLLEADARLLNSTP
jgi:filamentous hemagglutinin family protein